MRTSIRFQLTRAMLTLALVPVGLLGLAWLTQSSVYGVEETINLQNQIAQQVALQVSQALTSHEQTLSVVAKTYDLINLEEIRQKEILLILMNSENVYEEIELLNTQGHNLVHLSRVQVSPTIHNTTPGEISIPLQQRQSWYSPVYISPNTNEPLVKIIIPLITPRTGQANGLLVAHTRLKNIWELVANLSNQFNKEVYIIDGQNNLIAHPNPSLVLQRTRYQPFAARGIGTGLKGHWAIASTIEITFGSQIWTVVVESDPLTVLSPTFYAGLIILGIIITFTLLISWLSGLLAQRITQPLLRLIETIHAIRGGTFSKRVPITTKDETAILAADFNSMTAQLEETITSLEKNQIELRIALSEKEILLRELYHRTKNNMQVISSMLEMQAVYSGNVQLQALVAETQNRIRSMSLVHQHLYQTHNLSQISLKKYIEEFVPILMRSYTLQPNQVELELELAEVNVLIDSAIPCGLILNELISNSFKHGFPAGRTGKIKVGLRRGANGEVTFSVADNGVGVPPDFDFAKNDSLGVLLITSLSQQLKGQLKFDTTQGLKYEITFTDNLYQPRV